MNLSKIVKRFRVDKPGKFRLSSIDPGDTCGLDLDKDELKERMVKDVKRLAERQEVLYAQDRWAVLMIIQAMDAAGKDGIVEHVMSGVNPQGVEVHSFKAPSPQELEHDFLWRAAQRLPERGRIGIFNRSYYEETLVVRVHPEFLDKQKLPAGLAGKDIWKERFKSIRNFERHLVRNGTRVLKFHLRISKEEQRQRFLDRLEQPAKRWKFNMADVAERARWDDYMEVYEEMIRETSTEEAPWYVVPADNKGFARLIVAAALDDALDDLDLKLPQVANTPELQKVRQALLDEGMPKTVKKAAKKPAKKPAQKPSP
jgi:PPK2 family polyphosphate:nucleotide phosphotransferase